MMVMYNKFIMFFRWPFLLGSRKTSCYPETSFNLFRLQHLRHLWMGFWSKQKWRWTSSNGNRNFW